MELTKTHYIIIAVVVVAAIAIGAFAIMQNNNNGGSGDEPVTINVYRASFNNDHPDAAEVKAISDKINEYLASKKANVRINLKDSAHDQYPETVNSALKTKEVDLFWTASWESVIDCMSIYKSNKVYDLTGILSGTKLYDSMPKTLWDGSRYNGKNLFVPVYKDSVEGYDLIFNQEAVDAFGWDLSKITCLEDLEKILGDATAYEYPLLLQSNAMFHRFYLDGYDCGALLSNPLLAVDRSTNTVVNPLQTGEYLAYVKLMSRWEDLGYISSDEAERKTSDQTMYTDEWAISWWTDVPNNDEADARYGRDTSVVHITDHWASTSSTLGSCYAVSADCSKEKAKACVEFLGWLFTDNTVASLYTYGIQGTDYDLDANGQVVKKGNLYNHSMWESTSVLALDTLEKGEPTNKKDLYDKFNRSAKTSDAAGFLFDTSSIQDTVDKCNAIYNKIGYALETGAYSESEVENMVAELQKQLDAAGYQNLLKEAQNQYNAWKK